MSTELLVNFNTPFNVNDENQDDTLRTRASDVWHQANASIKYCITREKRRNKEATGQHSKLNECNPVKIRTTNTIPCWTVIKMFYFFHYCCSY